MKGLHKKIKELTTKSGKLETGKIIDNRARIIFKNTCELCYMTTFGEQTSRENMFIKINNNSLKHSNLVIVINIYGNNIDSILEFLSNKSSLKTELIKSDNEYIIIVGGSILEYKEMIRTIPDLNNNICQLIFDCLYQLDKRLFQDFIIDDIMKEDMFVYETEIEYPNKIENSNIIHIDNIMDLYSAVDGKIQLRRLMKFIKVTSFISDICINDLLELNSYSYKIVDEFVLNSNKKTSWAGNSWTFNSLGNLLVKVKNSLDADNNIKQLYLPLGTKVCCYVTETLDSVIGKSEFIDKYICDNFGEDIDINILKLPEYHQKKVCNDEIQYIDEVINEEIMSAEEYMNLYLEQNDEVIEEDNKDSKDN